MEVKELATEEVKVKQQINLIEGHFTAAEASDIVNAVLKVKINFHKLQRLSITEGNNDDGCEFDSSRINELLEQQAIAKDFFANARLQNKKLKMKSTIEISIED